MSIDYKSTGTLIGEAITTNLKIENIGPKKEFIGRLQQLSEAISSRYIDYSKIDKYCDELQDVLTKLWWEQEVLYQNINFDFENSLPDDIGLLHNIALAGINSLKLNKQRSDLTRKIDHILGEESSTVLEKSWKDA